MQSGKEMRMKLKAICGTLLALGGLGFAMVAGPSPAGATGPTMSVTIGGPIKVANHLLLTVPVNVVCDPIGDATTTTISDNVSVTVAQANGKSVSQAQALVSGGPLSMSGNPNPFLTCDGSTVNHVVVRATGNGPFHGGGAVASASAGHSVGTCTFFCTSTAFENGSTGQVAVNVKG
jgi:hypothetical protein